MVKYKEKQENGYHQGQDSDCFCGGRKEIIIEKGQLRVSWGPTEFCFSTWVAFYRSLFSDLS